MRTWVGAVIGGIAVAIGLFYIVGDDREAASNLAKNAGTIGTTIALLAFALSRFARRPPDAVAQTTASPALTPTLDSRVWIAAGAFLAGAVISATAVLGFQQARSSAELNVYRQWLAEMRNPRNTSPSPTNASEPAKSATALLEEWRATHQRSMSNTSNIALESLPPTASEVFALRSKCADLGRELLADEPVVAHVDKKQSSRYDQRGNRCYVKLRFIHDNVIAEDEFLFDGQTKQLLAYVMGEGDRRISWASEGPDSRSYEAATDMIRKYMVEER